MGFPTYVGAGQSGRLGGPGNLLPTYPTAAPVGGLYVLQVGHRNTANGILATLSVSPSWSLFNILTLNSQRQWLFTRPSTGAQTGTFTAEFIGAGTYTNAAICHFIGSVTATGYFDGGSGVTGIGGTNRTDAVVTTTRASCLALNFLFNNNAIATDAFVGATGGTWVAGASTSGGGDCRLGACFASLTSSITIDGGVLTQTSGAWICQGFGLAGVDAAGPTTIVATGLAQGAAFGGSPIICPVGFLPRETDTATDICMMYRPGAGAYLVIELRP